MPLFISRRIIVSLLYEENWMSCNYKLQSAHTLSFPFSGQASLRVLCNKWQRKRKEHGHIVRLAIWQQLFLGFWLVNTWFSAYPCDQYAGTLLEIVRQLTIRRSKKLDFQLSHEFWAWASYRRIRKLAQIKAGPSPSSFLFHLKNSFRSEDI